MARKLTHWEATGQFSVLSVDDDSVNLMVVENLLPQEWKIVSAQDSEEALAALEDETWPDFIFLDYQMASDLNGDEICRRMRQVFGGAHIPIVMCTAMTAGSQALQDCKDAGATDFLLKPYERSRMLEKINLYCSDKVQASRPPTAGTAQPPPPAPAPPAAAAPAAAPPPLPEPAAMEEEAEPLAPLRAHHAAPVAAPPPQPLPAAQAGQPEPMDDVVMEPSAHPAAMHGPPGWPSTAAAHVPAPSIAAPVPPVLQPPQPLPATLPAAAPPQLPHLHHHQPPSLAQRTAPPQQQPQQQQSAQQQPAPPARQPHGDLFTFFVQLDLEVVGKKLVDAGLTLEQLRAMDDVTLRRAGVVVKSQRDKVLQALKAL